MKLSNLPILVKNEWKLLPKSTYLCATWRPQWEQQQPRDICYNNILLSLWSPLRSTVIVEIVCVLHLKCIRNNETFHTDTSMKPWEENRVFHAISHKFDLKWVISRNSVFTNSRRKFMLFTHHAWNSFHAFTQILSFSRIHAEKTGQSRNHADLWGAYQYIFQAYLIGPRMIIFSSI